ncbi:MAG TPA: histidine kinase, partial [Candidatus Dormibacteraeota bacterium]
MREVLRSLWTEPRPPRAPRRLWYDWALVGVIAPLAILEGILRPDLPGRVFAVIVTLGLLPTLLWRRTRPLLMVAIVVGVSGVIAALTHGAVPKDEALLYLVLVPYALFRWGSGREVVIGSAILLAQMASAFALGFMSLAQDVEGVGVLVGLGALAVALRYRAMARARQLDQVKLLERERLARDLHDTVAHHVSAIAIRAQAGLAASAARPDAATDALRLVEGEATRALAEMRAMVHILRRNEPVDLSPTAGVSDLEQLAGRGRGGPTVEVEVVGDPDGLAPAVGTAIYRLAQESITNARRHARHATRIQVRVAVDDTSVHLSVSDDGEPRPAPPPEARGYGLTGMMERAGLLGGTLEAGPNPDRGWTVTAVLPRTWSTF